MVDQWRNTNLPDTTPITLVRNKLGEIGKESEFDADGCFSLISEIQSRLEKIQSDSTGLCAGCVTKKGTTRCGRCKSRLYCGVDCQRADWAKHKLNCHPEAIK
eukprot:TRINITY_DN5802_c0_g2_i1.p1 TRINITY_DN5802_c0_g2~~TRINITY_DN5802_c0_g2_i1.p1  ORF type:complete len:103 (-),score=14.52 TRINITY_DN5802_c0_g2_i1:69-377(-)